jgi:hypothetical protein
LLVGGYHLQAADVAAQVGTARLDILEQPGQRLHQPLAGLLLGHEGAAALDPLDDPFGLEFGQGLPDDGARHVVGRAELMIAGQSSTWRQLTFPQLGQQDLFELVVERQRRHPVDRLRHSRTIPLTSCTDRH